MPATWLLRYLSRCDSQMRKHNRSTAKLEFDLSLECEFAFGGARAHRLEPSCSSTMSTRPTSPVPSCLRRLNWLSASFPLCRSASCSVAHAFSCAQHACAGAHSSRGVRADSTEACVQPCTGSQPAPTHAEHWTMHAAPATAARRLNAARAWLLSAQRGHEKRAHRHAPTQSGRRACLWQPGGPECNLQGNRIEFPGF